MQGVEKHLPTILELLNKSQRQLQLNTLECLEALTRRYPSFKSQCERIQSQIAVMINESDLQRATLALRVATNLIGQDPTAKNHQQVIKHSVNITQSELIQGACLDQLQEFFKIASSNKIIDKASAC